MNTHIGQSAIEKLFIIFCIYIYIYIFSFSKNSVARITHVCTFVSIYMCVRIYVRVHTKIREIRENCL